MQENMLRQQQAPLLPEFSALLEEAAPLLLLLQGEEPSEEGEEPIEEGEEPTEEGEELTVEGEEITVVSPDNKLLQLPSNDFPSEQKKNLNLKLITT